ncbi:uracil-DNA glycosylase [Cognatishimia sp. SS12]|uniref:uracil-DNA glycosylase n=1 Tax=Cognatishimia sp. SS12 TaxID=2979465 RepID=UPI00232E0FA0|nr:uracil-DNA glycosylase [Cognatishimia sp. SS12]MDC0739100.1 uracil-DNA glycosylase [Cognatishimia sp. SS12]
MESALDYHGALALLDWQVELGATEAILDAPINRYEVPDKQEAPKPPAAAAAPPPAPEVDPVAVAKISAAAAQDLAALRAAMAQFDHCTLKRGARAMVFAEGAPAARVMVIGEAPDRAEDAASRPFAGPAGALFDKMFAAIDLDRSAEDRQNGLYVSYVLPWRPPRNWATRQADIAMMTPFLARHVALANPDILVLMGNVACEAALGKRGITRLRGEWGEAFGKPALPMQPPEALMNEPQRKRDAWNDLLSLKSRLTHGS